MGLSTPALQRRNLVHRWRAHLAVGLGVIVGTAALTGALLVGDSLRGSLRAAALERLGRIDYAVQAPTFFRAALGDDIGAAPAFAQVFARVCPAILVRGSARHAATHASVHAVTVLGVSARFWQLATQYPDVRQGRRTLHPPLPNPLPEDAGRAVVLNQALADDLNARPGDDILLRLARPAAVSPETLLGRRDEVILTLRLTVRDIIPARSLGAFALDPGQTLPHNAYVPLKVLQGALDRHERANTLLVAAHADASTAAGNMAADLQTLIQRHVVPADLGLRLRTSSEHGYIAVESEAFLLAPPVEAAARAAAEALNARAVGVLAYLANSIAIETRPDTAIPYSVVAAIDPLPGLLQSSLPTGGENGAQSASGTTPTLAAGEILLNDWAAADLDARPGDLIRLSYYLMGSFGNLETRYVTFHLRGVVRLAGAAADPGFTPEYPGVTDAENLADWHPPFPIDLGKVRPQDEAYWRRYRATPKAFVALVDGERLWAAAHERFGRLTSLRVYPMGGGAMGRLPATAIADTNDQFEREFLRRLDVRQIGLRVEAVRARALAASAGSTDFAGLFIGFSFFLIVSAAMLVALLFRLNVERRAGELGLLLATGFSPGQVARLVLVEGALLALVGGGLGLLAAHGYAWLMLAGLRSWGAAAVHAGERTGGTSFLQLHAAPSSYVIGYAVSVLVAVVAIAWSVRGITRLPPRALLAGGVHPDVQVFDLRRHRFHTGVTTLIIALSLAGMAGALVTLSLVTHALPQTLAFFAGGTALLLAGLSVLTHWLQGARRSAPRFTGLTAVVRLGLRNARRHPGRSLLTAGLLASATFVIAALQALRLDMPADICDQRSGTGGCALLAESDVPLAYDLNTAAGRRALNISDADDDALAGVAFIPFRLRSGDEASCLNLYRATEPRLLGATDAMIDRGGFTFAATRAQSEDERRNPWTLLRRSMPDGVTPAIADEAAARWQLHLGLGDELHVRDERGRDARLRLVALLKGSVLQGELIMTESHFARLFPSVSGHAFFLIAAPADRAARVGQTLERELADFGFAVTPAVRRLAELFAVQNTYLATFQTLGGLGLLLGTVGLAVVLLRNVWERRGELALLRTLGFSHAALGLIVLVENTFLVAVGLLIGLLSAAVVVAPHVSSRAAPLPWASLLLMFAAILVAGLLAGALALLSALRAPLLPALRSE